MTKELHLTRLNAKTEANPDLDDEFYERFANEPAEAVQWAFRDWRDRSSFYPAISDIVERVKQWKTNQRIADELKRDKPTEQDRQAGKVVDFAELKTKILDIAKRHGQVAPRVESAVKAMDHTFPPREELERRRQEQLQKIKAREKSS